MKYDKMVECSLELRLQSVMQEKEVLKMELSLEFYIAN